MSRINIPNKLGNIIIIIIFSKKGQYTMTFSLHQGWVVMSSQITHTQSSNTHPLAHITDTCPFIFSSCTIFTVYPNRIIFRHPSLLQMKTTRPWEGGLKEQMAKHEWPSETHSVTYVPGLSQPVTEILAYLHVQISPISCNVVG